MEMVKNAAGRLVPTEVNGQKRIPYKGVAQHRPDGFKAKPPIRSAADYPADGNKLLPNLRTALEKAGLYVCQRPMKTGFGIAKCYKQMKNGKLRIRVSANWGGKYGNYAICVEI